MSEAQKFQHIISGIREDLTFIENLYWILDSNLMSNPYLRSDFSYKKTAFEIREWINDVFLDKIYEINSKIHKFLTDISLEEMYKKVPIQEMEKYIRDIMQEQEGLGYGNTYLNLDKLKIAISNYRYSIDTTMDYVRKFLYETNWVSMRKINIEDYLFLTKRHKYITARQELENARQAVRDGKYENVLNHIRPAIELAIKERFGFTRFKNFWEFLVCADNSDFPLPSYDMLYFYFKEGSGRLHSGRLHTPLECQTALDFADGFIDRLELINISQEEIDNFKKNCKWVE
jgi:hypothetical protein